MNRLDRVFTSGKKALVIYATSGDGPSSEVFRAAAAGGADVLEVGIPFSDPTADGPAIQAAAARALAAGGGFQTAFADVRKVRDGNPEVGVITFGYANPYLQARAATGDLAATLVQIGADGALCVDLPPEEDDWLGPSLQAHGLHPIRLVAPTSTDARIVRATSSGGGFLYIVAVTGVTGGKSGDAAELRKLIARVRKKTKLPVVIGFGIRTPDDAVRMAELADGVVVGTAVVEKVASHGASAPAEVERFVRSIRSALR